MDFLVDIISGLEEEKLIRHLRDTSGPQGAHTIINGKEVINFCSNNYLGLANDERIVNAAVSCVKEEGWGSGASRLVCGNMSSHRALEEQIAKFKNTERCLVFSSGYMANVGIISGLFGRDDMIFSDKLNHASIVDGIVLSRAKFQRYAHRDMIGLEEMLKKDSCNGKKCIITDSVFSMDGDIAPLDKIVALAQKYNCLVMVDEAHALGVMGTNGKGLVEHFNVEGEVDIQMGTFSKAVGSFGAYVCGSDLLIESLINRSRSFIYTTGMPPAAAAAASRGIEIISSDIDLRARLWRNTHMVRQSLQDQGFDIMDSVTPIIPVLVGDSDMALKFSDELFNNGIFISAIRPPTVPSGTARLRITVMATHSEQDINHLLEKLNCIGKKLCLI